MSKKGLPTGIAMRHDSHYVEELSKPNKSIGRIISINLLEPNPEQPRVEIGSLEDLSDSIREKGILEPILVKPNHTTGNFMIIAGERRWRAANLAGLREVPCIELDLDERAVAEIALIENLQRKDLTIWEEADGLAALKEKFSYKHEDIAKKISKSRSTVTELLSVAGIPNEIRARCRDLNISSKSTLLEIARQFDERAMFDFLDDYKNGGAKKILNSRPPKPGKPNSANGVEAVEKIEKIEPPPTAGEIFAAKKNIFNFETEEFDLTIEFKHLNGYDKKNILRALKQAFDKIKAGAVQPS